MWIGISIPSLVLVEVVGPVLAGAVLLGLLVALARRS
jgi:hypothetical protein